MDIDLFNYCHRGRNFRIHRNCDSFSLRGKNFIWSFFDSFFGLVGLGSGTEGRFCFGIEFEIKAQRHCVFDVASSHKMKNRVAAFIAKI